MPAERRPGMDHEHYAWSPINERAALRWPDDAPVALCAVVSLEHMEWQPPEGSFQAHNLAGGLGRKKWPDYARLTHREYGHRVGIFRVLDALEKHGVPATIAMDALTAEHYPYLVRHCLERGCEIIAHGQSVSRMITSRMSEAEEREYIATALAAVGSAVGTAPAGWLGPEYGESTRTPRLLAEAGLRFVCDWVNDEQPYRMTTPTGELYALPLLLELNDVHALLDRRMDVRRYGRLLVESAEGLKRDGATSARLLAVHLHPWLIGQPFRIGVLEAALAEIRSQGGIWATTAGAVIDWFRDQPAARASA